MDLDCTRQIQRNSKWEKIHQEVTCAICLELLDDPKSMPCLHTYCKKCLMEALAKRPCDPDLPRDRPAINCPLCRAEITLPDKGIEGLPSNFSATRKVETIKLQSRLNQNRVQKCDGCKECIAMASCCECGGVLLCTICYKAHQNLPLTKNHHYVLLNELTQSENPAMINNKSALCQKHPQELLKLYCQDCEMLVCRDCVLVMHRSHDYSIVDVIAEKEKANLRAITLNEIEQMLNSTSQAIDEVKEMQGKVQNKNDKSIAKLDQVFKDIAIIMQNRKQVFLQKIQQVTDQNLILLKTQQEELAKLKKKLEHCRDFIQGTLHNSTNSEIVSTKKQMLSRTKHLQEFHKRLQLSPVRKPTTVEYYQLDKIKEDIDSVGVIVDCRLSTVQSMKEQNKTVVAKITVKDISGQCLSDATDFISVRAGSNDSVEAKVENMGSGTYVVSFNSVQHGEHSISVSIAGENISCVQPFKFHFVREKTDMGIANDDSQAEDDDLDIFGSDALVEAERVHLGAFQGRRHQQKSRKKSRKWKAEKKTGKINVSKKVATAKSFTLDVEPWDNEVDLSEVERLVRSIEKDGVIWGASRLVTVVNDVNKLEIMCVLEDDSIGIDDLEEEILAFDDYVQSVIIVAFNKVSKEHCKSVKH